MVSRSTASTNASFDIAVFTNLYPDHLDFHQTLEGYIAAKGRLFSMLDGAVSKEIEKAAILNADDSSVRAFPEPDQSAHHHLRDRFRRRRHRRQTSRPRAGARDSCCAAVGEDRVVRIRDARRRSTSTMPWPPAQWGRQLASTLARRPPLWRHGPARPGGWRLWMRANRSRCSSTLRTRRIRFGACLR